MHPPAASPRRRAQGSVAPTAAPTAAPAASAGLRRRKQPQKGDTGHGDDGPPRGAPIRAGRGGARGGGRRARPEHEHAPRARAGGPRVHRRAHEADQVGARRRMRRTRPPARVVWVEEDRVVPARAAALPAEWALARHPAFPLSPSLSLPPRRQPRARMEPGDLAAWRGGAPAGGRLALLAFFTASGVSCVPPPRARVPRRPAPSALLTIAGVSADAGVGRGRKAAQKKPPSNPTGRRTPLGRVWASGMAERRWW